MLNINQSKAVQSKDRFIFLLAGAGTGKTRVIVKRVNGLIKKGIKSEEILVLSFTNKSVNDLKQRILDKAVITTTYHGLCHKLLSKDLVVDIIDSQTLIEAGFTLDQLRQIMVNKRNGKLTKLVKKYNNYLRKYNFLDFIDLEIKLYNKLQNSKTYKSHIASKFKYIFVDEFQDTSLVQFYLLKMLVGNKTSLFCVGDPNQAVYSFRGASKKVIKNYINYFNAKVYYLNLNYRSKSDIIVCANNVISYNNFGFNLKLDCIQKDKGLVKVSYFKNFMEQNAFIDKTIRNHLKVYKQTQIAIIYRNHFIANNLKKHFYRTYYFDLNFLTIHQVKGLEFEVVFFIGLEEGNLPMNNLNIKEERNLYYVGLTRAKSYLYLCSITKDSKPSRFIKESF